MSKSARDFYRKIQKETTHIPLGDYIKNYEFLTGETFTIEQQEKERKNYQETRRKNNTYLDEIF